MDVFNKKKLYKKKRQRKEQQINTRARLFFYIKHLSKYLSVCFVVQAGSYDFADSHKAGQYYKN